MNKQNTREQVGPLCSSGVPGLDEILNGGFRRRRLYLIRGRPGAGKTTTALQFLLHGLAAGESGLSETREELELVSASHGWSLAGVELIELTLERCIRTKVTAPRVTIAVD